MIHPKTFFFSVVAALGLACTVFAATDATSPTTPAHSQQWRGHHGLRAGMHSSFMHAVRQLNLSDDQKQRISSLLGTQRESMRANADALRANFDALANPGDPNYSAAVSAAKTAAANAIQNRSDLEVQIYGLLTPDQQAQLPKVLADMKTRTEQRRAQWEQQRATKQTG
jgi:Spy/CpxP family protein refolding chaperone